MNRLQLTDRLLSELQRQSCNGVVNSLAPIGGSVQLELIVDRKTIEIFGNNGQLYMPWPANNPAAPRGYR